MDTRSATAGTRELTLKDRLSRLTYTEACKLLGTEGPQLIRTGGGREIQLDGNVHLGDDLFRLSLPEAVVTITTTAEARQRILWNCTQCEAACEHVGAAFSVILEEKMVLGLAVPPRESVPVESLSEPELIRAALEERAERARTERMRIQASEGKPPWLDYLVTNKLTGRTYRVALRGAQRGDSYCTCPDFRKNTLGTCKHIMRVLRHVKKHHGPDCLKRRYAQKGLAVHLRYGTELELRLLVPDRLDDASAAIIKPLRDRAIHDTSDLLRRIQKLAAIGQSVTVFPDAEEHIQRMLSSERLAAIAAEIRRDPRGHKLRKELLKVELLPYQMDGIGFAVGAGRAILADDMGLGKTIQGIGMAELLAREADLRKVLIVCPASLKSQWRSEIERFCGRSCQLVLGSAAERVSQYNNDCFFTICNYEQVLRDIMPIENVNWDLIILDEGQRIKNWETKTSRIIKGLRSPFALVLSGTPLENRLDDLFSVAEFIDDRRLGPAFRFFNRHRIVDDKGKVLGYKNLTELRSRLSPVLLRRTRDIVMRDLPPRQTEIIRIIPTAEQHELHRSNMQIVRSIVGKKFISEMDLLRLRMALLLCRMSADSSALVDKQKPGYSSKLEQLDHLLEQLAAEGNRKILLFSEWTSMLDLIEPLLRKHGLAFVRLQGDVPQKKRQELVHRFQNEPDCRAFITTNAGSTGLNLQAANTVINVDLPWNPAVLEQRIARAHRMGQKQPVQVFILITVQTIEENLLTTLSAKRDLALAALDAESTVDTVKLATGMDELKRRLEVLLGARPVAPIDASQKQQAASDMARVSRQEQTAAAAGQLLTAALGFLGTLVPPKEETDDLRKAADEIKTHFQQCLGSDQNGRPTLTISLPDSAALDALSQSLARLLQR